MVGSYGRSWQGRRRDVPRRPRNRCAAVVDHDHRHPHDGYARGSDGDEVAAHHEANSRLGLQHDILCLEVIRSGGLFAVIAAELFGDVTAYLERLVARYLDGLLTLHRQIAVAFDLFLVIALDIDIEIPVYFFVFIPLYN